MAAELIFTDEKSVLTNFSFSNPQMLLLRLHHRQMVVSGVFTKRVSYQPASTNKARYYPSGADLADIQEGEETPTRSFLTSTGKRSRADKPRFIAKKPRKLF